MFLLIKQLTQNIKRLAIHFHISHFAGISQMFSRNTPRNTKHSLYTFQFCQCRDKMNTKFFAFSRQCQPWCEKRKKGRETPRYTLFVFRILRSFRVFCNKHIASLKALWIDYWNKLPMFVWIFTHQTAGFFYMTTCWLIIRYQFASFWPKNNVAVVYHHPYLPDLTPAHYFFVSKIKIKRTFVCCCIHSSKKCNSGIESHRRKKL